MAAAHALPTPLPAPSRLVATRTKFGIDPRLCPTMDEVAARPEREPAESSAFEVAAAAFADHARRWVQARRDTLAELGSDAEPCRDVRLDLSPAARLSPLSIRKARLP